MITPQPDDPPTRASIARVYDAALGGTDNFDIDRQVLAQVRAVAPEVNDLAWSNRRFLARAVRFVADQGGIRQFLDCGSGLPTAENTHQIARRIDAATRVVYVDNDPAVIAHATRCWPKTRCPRWSRRTSSTRSRCSTTRRFAASTSPAPGAAAGRHAAPLRR